MTLRSATCTKTAPVHEPKLGFMRTDHRLYIANANHMADLPPESIHIVVTSPPYPMIGMWDESFASQDPSIATQLRSGDGWGAFRRMHNILDVVWRESARVLANGGIACINIGDATRTIAGAFALYPNHARILSCFVDLGFTPLPAILWRKQTNAPNKFMGSGMLPPGAYVTLEHEYVLILRKGDKRPFVSEDAKAARRSSSFFWEERNHWYSDVWLDLKGVNQSIADRQSRDRSAAFPFELPYRLISMFSVKGDTVLDPFLGLGTTMLAAMAAGRNSVGYEMDPALRSVILDQLSSVVSVANERIDARLKDHGAFVRSRHASKGVFGYRNTNYFFPVVTRQEVDLLLNRMVKVEVAADQTCFQSTYLDAPAPSDIADWESFFATPSQGMVLGAPPRTLRRPRDRAVQLDLFDSIGG